MDLISAVRSGKRFRHHQPDIGYSDWFPVVNGGYNIPVDWITSDNWEIEEPKKPRMLAWLREDGMIQFYSDAHDCHHRFRCVRAPWLDEKREDE